MTKILVSAREVNLPHATMVELRKSGKLLLGIDQDAALRLHQMGISPKGGASAAFNLFSWVAILAFGIGLYFAFTSAWWWGLVGLFAMVTIWRGNKSGHSDNVLDGAMHDETFYEKVRSLGAWKYQIDADVVSDLRGANPDC